MRPSLNINSWLNKTAGYEGFKPKVYKDSRGIKTIGYGTNLEDKAVQEYLKNKGYSVDKLIKGKQQVSKKEANVFLKDKFEEALLTATKTIPNFKNLPEAAQYVTTDMLYNLGQTKFNKFKKLIKAVEQGNFPVAAEELKNSNYFVQVGNRSKAHYKALKSLKPIKPPVDLSKPQLNIPMYNNKGTFLWSDETSPATLEKGLFEAIGPTIKKAEAMQQVERIQPEEYAKGGLIKRADGSYSQRGLWDNIRANRGSGRKPTAEMLRQEKKISKKENGGWLDSYEDGSEVTSNPLMNIPESQRFPKQAERTVVYPQGYIENKVNPNTPRTPLNFMGQPFATGAIEESISPLDLIGGVRGGANLVKGTVKYLKAAKKYKDLMQPNYVDFYGDLIDIGASPRAVRRTANQMSEAGKQIHKGVRDIVLPNTFEYGGSIADQKIPTPTSPNYYPDYTNPTLTNYQMGTPKSNLPIRGLRDATPEIPAYGYGGMINKYAAGATVWTKQDTPTWAAGTPTPTATQNFRNDRSLNTDRYRIGDVVPTGMDYKSPAAGTYDYSKDIQPYHTMRLHAPTTTKMAKHGGEVTEEYKKRAGIPYAINPGISDAGMYVGPTTQRGITFGNGGDVPPYITSDPKKFAERNKALRDSSLAYNLSRRNELIFVEDPFDPRLPKYQEEMNILAKQLNLKPYKYKQGWDKEDIAEFSASNPDAEYYLQSDEPYIGLFKKPTQKVIFNPEVTKMPMRGMPSINREEAVPQKVTVPKTNLLPAQYMDTRGEWSSTPQVPPGYTEEQLLKMGYRAPQKKAKGGWLDTKLDQLGVKKVKPHVVGGFSSTFGDNVKESPIMGGSVISNFGHRLNPKLEGKAGFFADDRGALISGQAGISPYIQASKNIVINPFASVGLTGGITIWNDQETYRDPSGNLAVRDIDSKLKGHIFSKAGINATYTGPIGKSTNDYVDPYIGIEYIKDPFTQRLPISAGVRYGMNDYVKAFYDPLTKTGGGGIDVYIDPVHTKLSSYFKAKRKPKNIKPSSKTRYAPALPEKHSEGGWLDNL